MGSQETLSRTDISEQETRTETKTEDLEKNSDINSVNVKSNSNSEKQTRGRSPRTDQPSKRRRKFGRPARPRRDNRKSRFDADFIGDDERQNAEFEAYYREQLIVPEAEFSTLMKTLATPLPSSFRIAADSPFREGILKTLQGDMKQLFNRVGEGSEMDKNENDEPLKPPAPLPWYPNGLAWTVSAPRQMLRRDNVLAPFHQFIVKMHELGAINRQEAVSMVPPLFLDVQKGHAVIDLCAAPGSKTAQLLEAVCGRRRALTDTGIVVANDADLKRCWMLSHQMKRFGSAELVVTHHEAQHFPKFMMFDRVLCDVPCSGDGTLRKAPDIWRRWNSHMGISLHRLQRQIVDRGVDILKPGGRLVYSTCSMNPIENEAIVAHVLRKYGEDIELLDCSEMFPGLIRRPGLLKWLVKDNSEKKEGENGEDSKTFEEQPIGKKHGWFRTFDEVPHRRRVRIVETLFPPSEEEMKSGQFKLERCMRLVPYDQDTGAFFVAVFHKKITARMSRRQRQGQQISEHKEGHMDLNQQIIDNDLESPNLNENDNDEICAENYERLELNQNGTVKDSEVLNSNENNGDKACVENCEIIDQKTQPDSEIVSKTVDVKVELEKRCKVEVENENHVKVEAEVVTHAKVITEVEKKIIFTKTDSARKDENMEGSDKPESTNIIHGVNSGTCEMNEVPAKTESEEVSNEKEITECETGIVDNAADEKLAITEKKLEKHSKETVRKRGIDKLLTEDPLVGAGIICLRDLESIIEFFGLERHIGEHYFMTRGKDEKPLRRVVALSRTARTVVRHAIGSEDPAVRADRRVVRVVNAGVRVLERTDRNDTSCGFRLIHDGIGIMRNIMTKRIIDKDVERDQMWRLLRDSTVKISDENTENGTAFWKRVLSMESGSAVLVCEGEEIIVWIGKRKVDLVMTPEINKALLTRFQM